MSTTWTYLAVRAQGLVGALDDVLLNTTTTVRGPDTAEVAETGRGKQVHG
jgi:hypothetical protein